MLLRRRPRCWRCVVARAYCSHSYFYCWRLPRFTLNPPSWRHIGWVRKKRAQDSHAVKLQGKAQAIMVRPATCDMTAVGVVQVEMAGKLLGGRFSSEATIPLGVFVREEVDWHRKGLRVDAPKPLS